MLEILGARLHTISDQTKILKLNRKIELNKIEFDFFPFSCYNNIIGAKRIPKRCLILN